MSRTVALAAVTAALALAAAAVAVAAPHADGVWVNGAVHALVTGPPPTGASRGAALYVIAPISPAHPLHPLASARLHGFGAHDHVFARTPYQGACDLHLVVPGPKAKPGAVATRMTLTPAGTKPLLYAAMLSGKMQPLDRTSRIAQAVAAGLARAVDVHVLLSCSVS